jgi:hypothetical protein
VAFAWRGCVKIVPLRKALGLAAADLAHRGALRLAVGLQHRPRRRRNLSAATPAQLPAGVPAAWKRTLALACMLQSGGKPQTAGGATCG